MAVLYSELGKYAEAVSLYAEALNHRRTTLGNDHPETLHCMLSLGQARCSAGDREGGVPLLHEASQCYAKVLGKDHPDTIAAVERLNAEEETAGEAQPESQPPLEQPEPEPQLQPEQADPKESEVDGA
jgi:hypothetical protein